jgi:hypothetical protein
MIRSEQEPQTPGATECADQTPNDGKDVNRRIAVRLARDDQADQAEQYRKKSRKREQRQQPPLHVLPASDEDTEAGRFVNNRERASR